MCVRRGIVPAVGGTDLSSSFPCLEVCAVGAISTVLPLFDVLVRESIGRHIMPNLLVSEALVLQGSLKSPWNSTQS